MSVIYTSHVVSARTKDIHLCKRRCFKKIIKFFPIRWLIYIFIKAMSCVRQKVLSLPLVEMYARGCLRRTPTTATFINLDLLVIVILMVCNISVIVSLLRLLHTSELLLAHQTFTSVSCYIWSQISNLYHIHQLYICDIANAYSKIISHDITPSRQFWLYYRNLMWLWKYYCFLRIEMKTDTIVSNSKK